MKLRSREKYGRLIFKADDMKDDDYSVSGVLSTSLVDRDGERVLPEALKAWVSANDGAPLPMFREHDRLAMIGQWTKFKCDDMASEKGEVELRAEGMMFPEITATADTRALMARDMIKDISVGMRIGDIQFDKGGAMSFGWVDIKEASLVAFGSNPGAQLDASEKSHRSRPPLFKVKNGSPNSIRAMLEYTDLDAEERKHFLRVLTGQNRSYEQMLWEALS